MFQQNMKMQMEALEKKGDLTKNISAALRRILAVAVRGGRSPNVAAAAPAQAQARMMTTVMTKVVIKLND